MNWRATVGMNLFCSTLSGRRRTLTTDEAGGWGTEETTAMAVDRTSTASVGGGIQVALTVTHFGSSNPDAFYFIPPSLLPFDRHLLVSLSAAGHAQCTLAPTLSLPSRSSSLSPSLPPSLRPLCALLLLLRELNLTCAIGSCRRVV